MKMIKTVSSLVMLSSSLLSLNAFANSCIFEDLFYPGNKERYLRVNEITNDIRHSISKSNYNVKKLQELSESIDNKLNTLVNDYNVNINKQEMYRRFTFPDNIIDATKYPINVLAGFSIGSKAWKALERPVASGLLKIYGKEAIRNQYRNLSNATIRSLFLRNMNLGKSFRFIKFGGKMFLSAGASAVVTVGIEAAVCAATGAARKDNLNSTIEEGVFTRVFMQHDSDVLNELVKQLGIQDQTLNNTIKILKDLNVSPNYIQEAVDNFFLDAKKAMDEEINPLTFQQTRETLSELDLSRDSELKYDPNLNVSCEIPVFTSSHYDLARIITDNGFGTGPGYQNTQRLNGGYINVGETVAFGCFDGGVTKSGETIEILRCEYDRDHIGGSKWQYDAIDNCHGLRPIRSIWLQESPHCPDGFSRIRQFDGLNGDLNQDAGGKDIYVCQSVNGPAPVTELYTSSSWQSPHGFARVGHTGSLNGDLNQSAGGKDIILHFSTAGDNTPITDLAISETGRCPIGYSSVPHSHDLNGDLNQSAGGKDIFLCAKRDK